MQYPILLVDDNHLSLESTRTFLQEEDSDFVVHTALSGEEAIVKIQANPNFYALVLMDFHLPGKSGAESVRDLLRLSPDLFILIYSGDAQSQRIVTESWDTGAVGFIEKGEDPKLLIRKVRTWCKKYDETRRLLLPSSSYSENEKSIASIGLTGRSRSLANIAELIKRYGEQEANGPVLIRGESGTGKEMVAHAIHKQSPRGKRVFKAINCAAVQEALIESQLFGHEKGSFTSANSRMQGLFEAANGGTLFLDEIGDASLALQAKLLRALQEKKITPVGSTREIEVDVRIVAATHRNLEEMIKEKTFRQDLYYRLNVISIEIPPLRDRIEDIQPLVLNFLKKYNEGRSKPKQILLKTVKMLENHTWPGNIRELLNYVEQLLVNTPSGKITPEYLDGKFFEQIDQTIEEQTLSYLIQRQEREQREYVASIVQNHSVREAAKKMGVSKSTLHNMMKRFGFVKTEVGSQSGGLNA